MAKKATNDEKADKTSPKKMAVKKRPPSPKASKNLKDSSLPLAAQVEEISKQLQSLGNAKVRAMHLKNGSGDNVYGVKNGDIRTLAGKLKASLELALALWATGNLESQMLAALSIKAQDLSAKVLESMVRGATFPQIADWFHAYVTKEHPDKEVLREKWMISKDKMLLRAGWRLTAGRVVKQPDGLDLAGLLGRIEKEMAKAPQEVQWTMNMCLAEIGIGFPKHRAKAIAIGEKLGIYRDYPVSKGCTSPFAPIWIDEMVKRQSKQIVE